MKGTGNKDKWKNRNQMEEIGIAAIIQSLCSSRKYPYLPQDFFLRPPHASGNSNKASHISFNFWVLQNPPPPGNPNPFCGGSRDIFWDCKLFLFIICFQTDHTIYVSNAGLSVNSAKSCHWVDMDGNYFYMDMVFQKVYFWLRWYVIYRHLTEAAIVCLYARIWMLSTAYYTTNHSLSASNFQNPAVVFQTSWLSTSNKKMLNWFTCSV